MLCRNQKNPLWISFSDVKPTYGKKHRKWCGETRLCDIFAAVHIRYEMQRGCESQT